MNTRKLDGALPPWNWTRLMNETEAIFTYGIEEEGCSNVLGTLSEKRFVPSHPACNLWGKGPILTFSRRVQFEKLLCDAMPTGFSYMLSKQSKSRGPWTVALALCGEEEE